MKRRAPSWNAAFDDAMRRSRAPCAFQEPQTGFLGVDAPSDGHYAPLESAFGRQCVFRTPLRLRAPCTFDTYVHSIRAPYLPGTACMHNSTSAMHLRASCAFGRPLAMHEVLMYLFEARCTYPGTPCIDDHAFRAPCLPGQPACS
jgi:hypothetical protein